MVRADSPSAIAFTSSGCSLQKSAICSKDSDVFSTSHTAVALGIRGIVVLIILSRSLPGGGPPGEARVIGASITGMAFI
jgi:hypothetical protein